MKIGEEVVGGRFSLVLIMSMASVSKEFGQGTGMTSEICCKGSSKRKRTTG